nr:hypothetical protein [Mesobacillus boroniphilus]
MLFVGSGFVSPTMAKVVSKIPPLSSIFNSPELDLSERLTQALKKEGYPVQQVNEFVGGKNEASSLYWMPQKNSIRRWKTMLSKSDIPWSRARNSKGQESRIIM